MPNENMETLLFRYTKISRPEIKGLLAHNTKAVKI